MVVIALFALALALMGGGFYSVLWGAPLIVVERGWAWVIAGSVFASGGCVVLALAFVVRALHRLPDVLETAHVELGDEDEPALRRGTEPAAKAEFKPEAKSAGKTGAEDTGGGRGSAKSEALAATKPGFSLLKGRAAEAEATADVQSAVSPRRPETAAVQPPRDEPASPEQRTPGLPSASELALRASITRDEQPERGPAMQSASLGNLTGMPARTAPPPLSTVPEMSEPSKLPSFLSVSRETAAPSAPQGAAPTASPASQSGSRVPAGGEVGAAAGKPAEKPVEKPLAAATSRIGSLFGRMRDSATRRSEDQSKSGPAVAAPPASPAAASRPAALTPESASGARKPEFPNKPADVVTDDKSLQAKVGTEPKPADTKPADTKPVDTRAPEPRLRDPKQSAQDKPGGATVVGTYTAGSTLYVMYSDGSIEAETADGVLRFKSLDDLKEHVARGDSGLLS